MSVPTINQLEDELVRVAALVILGLLRLLLYAISKRKKKSRHKKNIVKEENNEQR